jgi:formylglycine-generating enzyme
MAACCSPSAPRRGPSRTATASVAGPVAGPIAGTVALPGGVFRMGSDDRHAYPEDGESPARDVQVAGFRISTCAVTNREWAEFAAATGHRTDAERYGWSFVFAGSLPDDFGPTRAVAAAPWWRQVEGADWAHPEGPHSGVDDRAHHPVVHVSWHDATAYAAWRGGRLPTEAEWEYAARGGLEGAVYPWGDEREPGGEHRMNVWQGTFPRHDSGADGWVGTCPVDAFAPNGYGLHNVCGNVWEWSADRWRGPDDARVSKGGSFLCHESYCRRYRVAARQGSGPDSSTANTGFRVAADLDGPA